MSFSPKTFGQLACADVVLQTGVPVETDCFVSRIPVWFEYVPNPSATGFFPFCVIYEGQINAELIIDIFF